MKRQYRLGIFLGGVALLMILVHLFLTTRIIDLADRNTTRKIELAALQNENRQLASIWETRVDPRALEKRAVEMGFGPPTIIYYLLIPTSEAGNR